MDITEYLEQTIEALYNMIIIRKEEMDKSYFSGAAEVLDDIILSTGIEVTENHRIMLDQLIEYLSK